MQRPPMPYRITARKKLDFEFLDADLEVMSRKYGGTSKILVTQAQRERFFPGASDYKGVPLETTNPKP